MQQLLGFILAGLGFVVLTKESDYAKHGATRKKAIITAKKAKGGEVEQAYIKFSKDFEDGETEEGVLKVDRNSPNHTKLVNGFLDLGFTFHAISKEEYEAYDEGDEFTVDEFKKTIKKK